MEPTEPDPRIISIIIEPGPTAAVFNMPEPRVVRATFADGTTRQLFEYYSDELHFTEAEFIGLTEAQARSLHHQRDVGWLRS